MYVVHTYVCTDVCIITKLCVGGSERVPADTTQSMYVHSYIYVLLCKNCIMCTYVRLIYI